MAHGGDWGSKIRGLGTVKVASGVVLFNTLIFFFKSKKFKVHFNLI